MTEREAPHDTREPEDQEKRGLEFLQIGFRRLDALELRATALTVRDRSSLAGDRDAASYNPIPDQVLGQLSAATDHLRALQVTVEDSGGKILAMSLFTLVRTAYEATGTGLWLLQPTSRDDRVLRSIQLTRENRRQLRTVMTELGKDDPGFTRMEARLNEIRMARSGLRDKQLTGLDNVSERLRSISRLFPGLVFPPLVLWQMASGIAHGNTSMFQQVLEREQVTPFTNGSANFRLTTSVVSIAMFYDAALTLVEKLIDAFESRNVTPSIDRSAHEFLRPPSLDLGHHA